MLRLILTLFAVLPIMARAQVSLQILPEPSFHLIPAETIVLQQLGSWGVNLSVSLSLPILNSVDVGVVIEPRVGVNRATPEERSLEVAGEDLRRSRLRTKGLSLSLGAGVGVNSGATGSTSGGTGLLGDLTKVVGSAVSGLLPAPSQSTGWGKADNVAKGEQGDQAVSRIPGISTITEPVSVVHLHLGWIPTTISTHHSRHWLFRPLHLWSRLFIMRSVQSHSVQSLIIVHIQQCLCPLDPVLCRWFRSERIRRYRFHLLRLRSIDFTTDLP